MPDRPDMMLWLSGARGVFSPRDFAQSFVDRAKHVQGVSDEDWTILERGPGYEDEHGALVSNELYWDTWSDVEQNAVVTDEHGHKYRLYQDGDLWLIPDGMEYNEETDSFDWPDERESDDEESDQ
jgi:hypothetical protein